MPRLLEMTLATLAVIAFASLARAEDKKADNPTGKFVSSSTGKITIKQQKEDKSFDLAASVKVTIKGKDGKVEGLKAGDLVKLTMTGGKVSAIETVEADPKS